MRAAVVVLALAAAAAAVPPQPEQLHVRPSGFNLSAATAPPASLAHDWGHFRAAAGVSCDE